MRCRSSLVFFALAPVGLGLRAQCDPSWLSGDAVPGISGAVHATVLWDPDGAGPATPVIVFGGEFTVAGPVAANGIAAWNPVTGTWSTFGSGMGPINGNGNVRALAVMANGDLVAAGAFATAGGTPVANIARWNGASWSPLGAGYGAPILSYVSGLAAMPNGDLVLLGSGPFVSRWDGANWSTFGAGGGTFRSFRAACVLPNGDLVVGGQFESISGVTASCVARWNGTAWSAMGAGFNSSVDALQVRSSGELVAGGTFLSSGATPTARLARWNGTAWAQVGAGWTDSVASLAEMPNGDLLIGCNHVGIWNGVSGSQIGHCTVGGVETVIATPTGDVVAAGTVETMQGVHVFSAARWSGGIWTRLTPGTDGPVRALAVLPDGSLVAGGTFTEIGGIACNRIARRVGATWMPMGLGFDNAVNALAVLPGGDLVAGGAFTTADGLPASRVARWNGAAWSELEPGINGEVLSLATGPGRLYVGGSFTSPARSIVAWNGADWLSLGTGVDDGMGNFSSPVHAIAADDAGGVYIGGQFTSVSGTYAPRLAYWTGSAWQGQQSFGLVNGYAVYAMALLADGRLVIGGEFRQVAGVTADCLAAWNGATWQAMPGSSFSSPVGTFPDRRAILELPNGHLLVGGIFLNQADRYILRWNGASWQSVGQGSRHGTDDIVRALALMPNGDVAVGGDFALAGDQASTSVAILRSPCAASVASFGAGCTGAGGPLALAADTLPWIGSTYQVTATGFGNVSLAFWYVGISTQSIPLPQVHPTGLPGCTLLTTLDNLVWQLPSAGTSVQAIPLPLSMAVVGYVLKQQVAELAFDVGGNLLSIATSNGLSLTIGAL